MIPFSDIWICTTNVESGFALSLSIKNLTSSKVIPYFKNSNPKVQNATLGILNKNFIYYSIK